MEPQQAPKPPRPHFGRYVMATIAVPDSSGRPFMKGFIAALIAGAILYVVDFEYNDGRYTRVVKQAATSLVGH
jgi:hypothetical protein